MAQNNTKYVTTTEACKIIGVSKTVIKRLADEGVLQIWRTPGGHRRLLRSSVDEYVMNNGKERANDDDERLKVLVVDDDKVSLEIIKSLVESLEFPIKVYTANNGFEGLMQAGRYRPDFIFTDLTMPQMDGYSMVQALRNFETTKDSTIMIMTGEKPNKIERDRLPKDITVIHKPAQPEIIKQFLTYEYHLKRG